MEQIQSYLDIFSTYPHFAFAIAFFAVLVGGEPVVMILSFLSAAHDFLPFWQILIIGYITALIGELFWFNLARNGYADFLSNRFSESRIQKDFSFYFEKAERNNPLRLLFVTRFISGLTLLVIIYLGRKKNISQGKFILYCLITNLFWTPLVTSIGWSGGKGFTLLFETFHDLYYILGFGFLFFIVVYLGHLAVGKYVLKHGERVRPPK